MAPFSLALVGPRFNERSMKAQPSLVHVLRPWVTVAFAQWAGACGGRTLQGLEDSCKGSNIYVLSLFHSLTMGRKHNSLLIDNSFLHSLSCCAVLVQIMSSLRKSTMVQSFGELLVSIGHRDDPPECLATKDSEADGK